MFTKIKLLSASVLVGMFCVAHAQSEPSSAQSTAPQNLISNPGFEENSTPWQLDNWAHNDATAERDTNNPHSGKYSMRVSLNQVLTDPNLMFAYPSFTARPGGVVKLTFWARGVSNGPPLIMMIRKHRAPYTTYFSNESGLTDDWQKFTYTISIPSNAAPEDISLRFQLRAKAVFWIDDVSIEELPDVVAGETPKVNPVRNASFEVGTDGWTALIRSREFKELKEESGSGYPCPPDARLDSVEEASAPEGKRVLSFKVAPECRAFLTSSYFPARYGHKIKLSFSLRSDGEHAFNAGVVGGKNWNTSYQTRPFKSSTQWQKFSFPLTLKPSPGGLYFLSFSFEESAKYELDAVTLVEEEQTNPILYPDSAAIVAKEDAPVGNLYDLGQKATFDLNISGEKPSETKIYQLAVLDFLGRKIAGFDEKLSVDAEGRAKRSIEVPTTQYGAFKITAKDKASGELLAEQIYSVLPKLPPPSERPNSFFGGHSDLTPYNLEIMRKGGFRWLRLYSPLNTLWMAVEPSPGEWVFTTDNVAYAKSQGFKILSGFNTAPRFEVEADPKNPLTQRWCRSYPPKDLNAWKNYVTKTFNVFSPYVDTWEVWNEPDGDYLLVKSGVKKDEVMLELIRSTREALEANGKPFELISTAVSNINAELGWKVLEKGGGKYLDAYSFHFYSLSSGGDNPDDAFVLSILKRYRTFKNNKNEEIPLWHTEGGIYLNGGQSWYETYRIPHSSVVTPSQGGASMVRAALLFKSMGVKRYFDFQLGASRSGRRIYEDGTSGFIDVTGIPGPALAAHAAMVKIVEDAEPAGFDSTVVDNVRVKVAHFKTVQGKIDVYWASSEIPLSKVAPSSSDDEVRDLMGNEVSYKESKLGEFPLYVIQKQKTSGSKK